MFLQRPCNTPSLVGDVKATDADNGRNSQLTYSMMVRKYDFIHVSCTSSTDVVCKKLKFRQVLDRHVDRQGAKFTF